MPASGSRSLGLADELRRCEPALYRRSNQQRSQAKQARALVLRFGPQPISSKISYNSHNQVFRLKSAPRLVKKYNNYTRQESNRLLAVEACHRNRKRGEQWRRACVGSRQTDAEKSHLSKQDVRLLLVMCAELVNLCARLTGNIDPAAAAMLTYVRDDIQLRTRLNCNSFETFMSLD